MLKKCLNQAKGNQITQRFFSSSNILIKSGVIVNSDEKFKGGVLIKDGKIAKVLREHDSSLNEKDFKVINANGNYIIPGGIDTHTHLQMPFMGTVAVDDFEVGSKAAVAGGTTLFIDFAIPDKNEGLLHAYDKWRKWADPKVNCDYSLHVAITSWNENVKKEMAEIVKRGVTSFKVFLAYKGALMLNDSEFLQVLDRCKELGAICLVHAETGELIYEAQQRLLKLGVTGPEAHYFSRPESFEAQATHNAITIAGFNNAPLYIVHVMSKEASEEVIKAKKNGNILFAETLAAALGTDGRNLWNKNWDIAAAHVMSPPLNPDPTTKTHLMKLLQSGTLNTVATDNCTFCNSQKRLGIDNFTKIPNGVNGIEDRLAIVWTKGVKEGLLSPSDFVRVTSTSAAQIFNLYPKKGIIREGADADLVIWNGEKERVLSKHTHHQAVDFNVFEGMKVNGQAELTMVNGKILWENENFTKNLKPGSGKYIARQPFGFAFERLAELERARDPRNFKVDRDRKESTQNNETISLLQKEIKSLKDQITQLNSQKKSESESSTSSNVFDSENNFIGVDEVLDSLPKGPAQDELIRILNGRKLENVPIDPKSKSIAKENNFEIKFFKIPSEKEQQRPERLVRIGAVQNKIVLPTTAPVSEQKSAIIDKISTIVKAAHHSGVNVICFQECWTSPFFMCTREKLPWLEFGESPFNGDSTKVMRKLAKEYNMVVISPILERDDVKDIIWNTAVVIDNHGDILGLTRKIHIPRVGDFNESTYYMEGDTGNPVFETEFGNIGVNICYGRHHPLHWQALGLNGAEIVFNPSATVAGLSEHLWRIEARNAAIANSYFSVAINRVGTETFPNEFTSGDGKSAKKQFGHFYGSSYITAPDGVRTPGLSRTDDGLLITEVDLNLCRQTRDKWGFHMTARHDLYADLLQKYSSPHTKYYKQIIKKTNRTDLH